MSACALGPSQPSEPSVVDRNSIPPDVDAPPARHPSDRAVTDLILSSQSEYDKGDWQSAIAVAERALRIDRRQPSVYLLLAKSYRAMGETKQALQFVEQGQRYLRDNNSDIAKELNWLAEALE